MGVQSKTVISSMLWNLLERFGTQIVSFVISILLARILSPSEYGVIAIIIIFINLANVILDGGLNTALIQKKDADQKDFSTIFWFCLAASILLYAMLFLTAPLIASFYNNDILLPVTRVLGLVLFVFSANSIQRAYVSRHMLFKKLFWINAVAVTISGLIGIVMANQGLGVWALVGQVMSNPIVCCLMMFCVVKWRPTLDFSVERFKVLFDFGWKIFMTNFIVALYGDIRGLVIGKLYQPSVLAFFDRGKALPSLLMNNVMTSINTVLLPAFANEQDNIERVKQMMRRSVQVSYLFVAPLLVFFFLTAKDVVVILLTEKWLPIVPFIRIFCIAFFLMPIQNINAIVIQSLGYSNITLRLEIVKKIIEAVILVVSFLIDVYAVAWGIVVYNAVCIVINLYPNQKLIGYGPYAQIKDIFPTMCASFVMGGGIYACASLQLNSCMMLSLQVIVGTIIYYVLCRLLHLESFYYVKEYVSQIAKAANHNFL